MKTLNLTENEYNLVVYCLEQQMYEFNKDEQNDANNIVIKLSNLVESKLTSQLTIKTQRY